MSSLHIGEVIACLNRGWPVYNNWILSTTQDCIQQHDTTCTAPNVASSSYYCIRPPLNFRAGHISPVLAISNTKSSALSSLLTIGSTGTVSDSSMPPIALSFQYSNSLSHPQFLSLPSFYPRLLFLLS